MDDKFKTKDEAEKSFGELESQGFGDSNDVVEATTQDEIQQDDVADFAQKEGQEGQAEAQKDGALESSTQQDGDIKEEAAEGATEESDGFGAVENEAEAADDAGAQDSVDAEKADAGSDQMDGTGDILATNSVSGGKEKRGRGRVFALAAILVLVLAGCVGAYFMAQPGEEKKANQKPEEQKEVMSSYRLSGNDLSNFDLRFLQIENKEDNVIYSPLSIKYALAMLKDGANGDTKKQIEDLIGDYKAKKYINSKNISLANAMFVRDSYKEKILDSYITGLKDNYNAEVISDSFTNANTINNWVSNKTLKLIEKPLSDSEISDLDYVLVNALAIDQNWNYLLQCTPNSASGIPCKGDKLGYSVEYAHENYSQYVPVLDERSHETMKFNGLANRKAVKIAASFNRYDIIKDKGEGKIKEKVTEEYKKWLQEEEGKSAISEYKDDPTYFDLDPSNVGANVEEYMKELKENLGKEDSSTDFYLNDAEDAKVFAKDLREYDGNTLQYVGIMPKNTDLKSFVSELSAEKATGYIKGLKELKKENFKDGVVTSIEAHIPLFEYDYQLALKDDLEKIGVTDAFDQDKADLSKLSSDASYIKLAKHMAKIEFSNEGIKAGASTILGGAKSDGGGGDRFDYLWDVPIEKIDLTFNKPFLYLIRDKSSGEIWFTGAVYQPIEYIKK